MEMRQKMKSIAIAAAMGYMHSRHNDLKCRSRAKKR